MLIGKRLRSLWTSVLIFCLVFTGFAAPAGAQSAGAGGVPPLLITEVVPDSTNYGTADGFEFIEIYNNTDQVLSLADYNIIYRYPTGPAEDVIWRPLVRDVEFGPGEAIVLWVGNSANSSATVADFNANYGTNLIENVNIVKLEQSGGMHNQRLRDMIIATNTGLELAVATYNYAVHDVQENMGIFYRYPQDGTNQMVKVSAGTQPATPGTVEPELVPETPVALDPNAVPTVTDITAATQSRDRVEIAAQASDSYMVATVNAYYRAAGAESFKSVSLVRGADGLYRVAVPFADLIGVNQLEYYVEASNGLNRTTSDVSVVNITTAQGGSATPPLLITEIVPDTTNYGGSDGYEFIEVYNNTTQPINFGDFEILYRYPGNTADVTWFAGLDGVMIAPGGTLVLWVENAANGPLTVADFNNQFKVSLVENVTIVKAPAGGGMSNTAERTLVIAAKTGEEIAAATYLPSDVAANRGIFYHFPIDGTNRMVKISGGASSAPATPGSVDTDLVPSQLESADPSAAPVIIDRTEAAEVKPGDTVTLTADVQDDVVVASVTLNYAGQEINLKRDADGLFRHTVTIDPAASEGELVYYFTASNGRNTSQSAPRSIAIVVEQLPNAPVLVSPAQGTSGVSVDGAELSVRVSDPNGEALDVRFYEGLKYDAAQQGAPIRVFRNTADREPPLERVPAGETEITAELRDGSVVTDAVEGFPYHRFEVTLDAAALEQETVEAVWRGSSLEGRKVTMYAWNNVEQRWVPIDTEVAASDAEFTLSGEVKVAEYVLGDQLNILVQDEFPARDNADYTFIWMSDTQFYTEVFPELFKSQVEWIRDNREKLNIQYVVHSGDLVNTVNREYQWNFADEYMGVLDEAGIPYGVLAGNHDVYSSELGYTEYYKYFGEDRFVNQPTYGGSFKNNRGHYDLVSVEGTDYIFVYMGWQPEADGIAWINEVLSQYPDRIAILVFHQYMYIDGERTEIGNRLYEQVVLPNPNVELVLSGHHHGSVMKTDAIDDNGDGVADRNVYQVLGDFQDANRGGEGLLNVISVDVGAGKMYIDTYSTDLDVVDMFPPYEIDLDLQPRVKRVATSGFEVNVYTDREIGAVSAVASGDAATVVWSDLEGDKAYYWYAAAANAEGVTASDIWSFRTEVTAGSIARTVDEYIASGDITGPMQAQLSNTARQIIHHYENGNVKQAKHFAGKLLESLNHQPLQEHISEQARVDLTEKTEALLQSWSSE